MTIDDIPYFNHNRRSQPKNYKLAKDVESYSANDVSDNTEFQRRLALLSSHKGHIEHQKQTGSLIAELLAYNKLWQQDKNPHWVPESLKKGEKMPDINYSIDGKNIPVEVKFLDIEKSESDILRAGDGAVHMETGPDWNYFDGVMKKLDYYFVDALSKVNAYNGNGDDQGELWLYYFPSLHVRLRDGEDGLPLMADRISSYALEHLDKCITLECINALEDDIY
jgi:hypothetical protein